MFHLGALSCFTRERCPLMLHVGTVPLVLHVGTTLIHAQLGRGAQTGVTWTWRPLMPRRGAAPTHGAHLRFSTWALPPTPASSAHSAPPHAPLGARHLLTLHLGTVLTPTRAPFGHGVCSRSIRARRPFLLNFGTAPTHASCGGGAHSRSSRLGTAPPPPLLRHPGQCAPAHTHWVTASTRAA